MAADIERIKEELGDVLRSGDEAGAETIARRAIEEGIEPIDLIQKVMVPILTEVGDDFQRGAVYLPELMLAGRAAERVSAVVEETSLASGKPAANYGTVVLGTVEGDMHDIGRDIVATMLNAHGFKVVNLGRDVQASAFLDVVKKEGADLLGLSALMTTTLPAQERTVRLFGEVGERDNYKIVIGGGATNQKWSDQIGADGYAADAAAAVDLCKRLMDLA
jgi:5-methyltetrahydrofolate--homocysteine methyltransferase